MMDEASRVASAFRQMWEVRLTGSMSGMASQSTLWAAPHQADGGSYRQNEAADIGRPRLTPSSARSPAAAGLCGKARRQAAKSRPL